MSQENLNTFRTWIAEQGLDAFLVTQPQNCSYLSGWLIDEEGASILLVDPRQQILLTNALYAEVAAREATGWLVINLPPREFDATLVSLAREHGWSTIGFESRDVRYVTYQKLSEAAQEVFALQPFETTQLNTMRQVKQ